MPPGLAVRVAGWHPCRRPLAATVSVLVPADDAVPAGGTVASLTLDQIAHDASCLYVVFNPRRRNTHDSPSYLAVESGEVGAEVDGEQVVHGLPLSGEREPPKYSQMLPR